MKSSFSILLFLMIIYGCSDSPSGAKINEKTKKPQYKSYDVIMGNASKVNIDVDKVTGGFGFGYLSTGVPNIGKSALLPVNIDKNFIIEWEEDEKRYTYTFDLRKYKSVKDKIKTFWFIYQGNGEWNLKIYNEMVSRPDPNKEIIMPINQNGDKKK